MLIFLIKTIVISHGKKPVLVLPLGVMYGHIRIYPEPNKLQLELTKKYGENINHIYGMEQ
ncbi:hypothetical protein D3C84_915220 [compost metagenome]